MKKPLLIICCLLSFYGWSQPNKDSILNEVNSLRLHKTELETRIENVKAVILEEMLAEEKLRSSFDKKLYKMDSLTGQKLKLERKKQPTPQQQAEIIKLNKLIDDYSKKVQDIDLEITTIIYNRRGQIQELQKSMDSVNELNSRIKEIEVLLK